MRLVTACRPSSGSYHPRRAESPTQLGTGAVGTCWMTSAGTSLASGRLRASLGFPQKRLKFLDSSPLGQARCCRGLGSLDPQSLVLLLPPGPHGGHLSSYSGTLAPSVPLRATPTGPQCSTFGHSGRPCTHKHPPHPSPHSPCQPPVCFLWICLVWMGSHAVWPLCLASLTLQEVPRFVHAVACVCDSLLRCNSHPLSAHILRVQFREYDNCKKPCIPRTNHYKTCLSPPKFPLVLSQWTPTPGNQPVKGFLMLRGICSRAVSLTFSTLH